MLEGKHIAVLGAGGSGRAAAKLAVKRGAHVCVYDSGEISEEADLPKEVRRVSNATEEVGHNIQCDMLVVSPGIDTYGSFVEAFSQGAGEVVGEVELACRFYSGKIIAITGTNGKTTTTEMIEKIMLHAGVSCVACGNYGVPVAEVMLREEVPEVLALEISSFQLETIKEFCPEVSIWLNFDADHLDRYKTIDDYKAAKLRIFENQKSEHVAVIRAGERVGEVQAKAVSFTSEHENADYTVKDMRVYHQGDPVVDLSTTKIRGLHNAENMMAATAAVSQLGVSIDTIAEALAAFVPPAHRCELVTTVNDVEYINDSKATNLHALDNALRSQSRPIILIAGGKDKGLNFEEISARVEERVKTAILIGEIADQLERELPASIVITKVKTLEDAVREAQKASQPGDAVLLSPGTSSFDMFKGYEDRGDSFKQAVKNLT